MLVAVPSGGGDRLGGEVVVEEVSGGLDYARLGGLELRARPAGTVEQARGRGEAGGGVTVRASEEAGKARVVVILGGRGGFGLVAVSQVVLDLGQLHLLPPLGLLELLHLELEAPTLLADALIFHLFLLQLLKRHSQHNKRAPGSPPCDNPRGCGYEELGRGRHTSWTL